MTKRVRGTARPHRRPGARPPTERPAGARQPRAAERPSRLETAEIIAEEVLEEPEPTGSARELAERREARAADAERRSPAGHVRQRIKAGSLLAARAATEYVYVAQDMRRIIAVMSVLVAVLIVLWLLIVVLRVIALPFY